MAAYFIVSVDVHDPAGYEAYRQQVPATIARYGGTYLVRGGEWQKIEGDWEPKRLVILRFESREQAMAWHDSDEYRPLRELRFRAAHTDMVLVEGL